MRIGLEIEAVYNASIITLDKGGYHDGNPLCPGWTVESDGSLHTGHEFTLSDTAEFVSKIIFSKKELYQFLDTLKKKLENGKKKRLNSLLAFNNSCGAHIHFSFNESYKCYNSLPSRILDEARTLFFNGLDKLSICPKAKAAIKAHYNRSYAMQSSTRQTGNRRVEWNFSSEEDDKGMEWRSFNLKGITKWRDIKKLYGLAWQVLSYIEQRAKNWVEPEEQEDIPILSKNKKKFSRMTVQSKELISNFKDLDYVNNTDKEQLVELTPLYYHEAPIRPDQDRRDFRAQTHGVRAIEAPDGIIGIASNAVSTGSVVSMYPSWATSTERIDRGRAIGVSDGNGGVLTQGIVRLSTQNMETIRRMEILSEDDEIIENEEQF